jgi:hypothetical protein
LFTDDAHSKRSGVVVVVSVYLSGSTIMYERGSDRQSAVSSQQAVANRQTVRQQAVVNSQQSAVI